MSAITEGLKKENESLKKELAKAKKEISNLNDKCESYELRIEHFAYDKKELLKTIRVFESLELELKMLNVEEMEIESNKLQHRTKITKKLLDDAKIKIENLNEFINKNNLEIANLNTKLDSAYDDIANLEEDLNYTRIKKNQRIYFLESRLDIAYSKIAELKFILNDLNSLGLWDRIRKNEPNSLQEYKINEDV